jgi:OmpA-OmpF porin, OOP family
MKTNSKIVFSVFTCLFFLSSNAQFLDKLAKKAEKATERAIERKVEEKATKKTNEAMDGVLNNKKTSKKDSNSENLSTSQSNPKQNKSDFVSGNKVIFEENFSRDAESDFPINWFTNSSGEITIIDGIKWLKLTDKGSFSPLNITKLPENFTFEFDVTTTSNFSFYSTPLNIVFTQKTTKADNVWNTVFRRNEGMIYAVHPANSLAGTSGSSSISVISEKKVVMKNNVAVADFNKNNNKVRVQVWRQKNRFRMYVDGKKIWDLPTAFSEVKYNQVIFFIGGYKNTTDKWFVSNLRLAEAGEDTRHQLLETGSFTTNEILFDTNKATIKPSSKKVLDELGQALKDNNDVNVSITGHTDSDGNDKDNLNLSKKRAEAVANYFVSSFGISKDRMETFGKGESEPLNENRSAEDKSQNRRVAFVVIK